MTDQVISPLRRRMIEDTATRKFAPKTPSHFRTLAPSKASLNHDTKLRLGRAKLIQTSSSKSTRCIQIATARQGSSGNCAGRALN
jgi:hypothetical protein